VTYIVLDFEFNQAFDFPKGYKSTPVPECQQEIIQIGAVALDESFAEIDAKKFIVKPRLYRRLHPYVKRITGIDIRDLKAAEPFWRLYREFAKFCRYRDGVLCFWGPDDLRALFENIAVFKQNPDLISKRYINIQRLCDAALERPANRQTGLKDAVLELCPEADFGPFHDALNDALYTAAILRKLEPKPTDIMRYNPQPAAQPSSV